MGTQLRRAKRGAGRSAKNALRHGFPEARDLIPQLRQLGRNLSSYRAFSSSERRGARNRALCHKGGTRPLGVGSRMYGAQNLRLEFVHATTCARLRSQVFCHKLKSTNIGAPAEESFDRGLRVSEGGVGRRKYMSDGRKVRKLQVLSHLRWFAASLHFHRIRAGFSPCCICVPKLYQLSVDCKPVEETQMQR